jgi:hypothetical protein
MSNEVKHESAKGHGSYERQDLKPAGILYFLLGLGLATLFCILLLLGVFNILDRREKADQPAMSPLITNVPADTRHIERGYPQSAFPSPKLEEDERGQLDAIRNNEDRILYSYGWSDEKAGTVHIPIERAMDLLVERGLPVRASSGNADAAVAKSESGKPSKESGPSKKGAKK